MFYRLLAFVALSLCAAPLWAATCAVSVDSTDAMKYNTSNINVPASCKTFTVTLTHSGKLPRNAMGHNWVLTTAADEAGVASDGIAAGLDHNYLKPGDKRVLAATRIIGAGETTQVTFKPSLLKAGGKYMFFCSFPGHHALMQGTVTLTK